MKNLFLLISFIVVFLSFASCDPENVIDNQNKVTDTLDYEWDSTRVVNITLIQGTITVSGKGATALGSTLTITKPGTYKISGKLTNGQIIVNTIEDGRVRLIMNNVEITNSSTSPLFIANAERTIIILPQGTTNTFTDGANYTITADSLNATIYSKDYLGIFGEGILNINANYRGGITSRDELEIKSGKINITSVTTGIRGKDLLKIYDGTFTVNCGGDAFKSDNDSSDTKGFVEIDGGNFSVICLGDGFSATKKINISGGVFNINSGGGSSLAVSAISTKGIKGTAGVTISGGTYNINSADNCIDSSNNITIDNGTFTLLSGNKPLDSDSSLLINNGDINITKAVKGISGHYITINGGKLSISSNNDCVKATLGADLTVNDGSSITINGGIILLNTLKGDALDSNGSIKITAGTVVVQGSQTSPDAAISYRSTCIFSGGTIVASGAATLIPGTSSTQNTVYIKFKSIVVPGTLINIQDDSANSLLTYKTTKYAYCVVVSLPTLLTGTNYNVYTGGTTTGIETNGLYNNGIYTAGTKKSSFTISTPVTSITF